MLWPKGRNEKNYQTLITIALEVLAWWEPWQQHDIIRVELVHHFMLYEVELFQFCCHKGLGFAIASMADSHSSHTVCISRCLVIFSPPNIWFKMSLFGSFYSQHNFQAKVASILFHFHHFNQISLCFLHTISHDRIHGKNLLDKENFQCRYSKVIQ